MVRKAEWPDSPRRRILAWLCRRLPAEMGSPAGAKRTLESLVSKYPTSRQPESARQKLKEEVAFDPASARSSYSLGQGILRWTADGVQSD